MPAGARIFWPEGGNLRAEDASQGFIVRMPVLDLILCVAAVVAGLAVATGCIVVLLVWIGGGSRETDATEAWRRADEA